MSMAGEICQPIVSGSTFPQSLGILGMDWIPLTLVALVASLLMMVLVHMFSNLLRNQPLSTWSKFEMFQVFATAGIFAFSFGIVIGMCTFNMGLLDARYYGLNMYDIAEAYFAKLKTAAYILFAYLMRVVNLINLLSRITWISNPLGMGMQDSPMEGIGQLNSVMFLVASGFFATILMLWLQVRMLDYMAIASLFYLFPLGMFFRAFEPTRKFGGTLLGISITFFLFFPMMIVFDDFIIYAPREELLAAGGELEQTAQHAEGNINPSTGQVLDPQEIMDAGYDETRRSPMFAIYLGNSVANGALFLLKPIMLYFIAAVVLPVINFAVLAEVARALTNLLGEEIDISNLTRMI